MRQFNVKNHKEKLTDIKTVLRSTTSYHLNTCNYGEQNNTQNNLLY